MIKVLARQAYRLARDARRPMSSIALKKRVQDKFFLISPRKRGEYSEMPTPFSLCRENYRYFLFEL